MRGLSAEFLLSTLYFCFLPYSLTVHKFKIFAEDRKFILLFNYLFSIRTLKKKMDCPPPDSPPGHIFHVVLTSFNQEDVA